MYAWIWRNLPFGRAGQADRLAAAGLGRRRRLLWYVVLPVGRAAAAVRRRAGHRAGVPGDPDTGPDAGRRGPGGEPARRRHDIPYATDQNNPPPTPRPQVTHARPGDRQLRLVRLQPGAVPRPARRRVRGAAQRRDRRGRRRRASAPPGVLLSPGPGTPERAGICIDVIREYAGKLPIFGVCLGHQAIGAAFGATVDRAPELLHGKTSEVHHKGAGVLAGLPDPFTATRYHSLAVLPDTLPDGDRGDRLDRVRRGDGDAAPQPADRGRAVPPGVGAHRGRPHHAGELAGHVRLPGRRWNARPAWPPRSRPAGGRRSPRPEPSAERFPADFRGLTTVRVPDGTAVQRGGESYVEVPVRIFVDREA